LYTPYVSFYLSLDSEILHYPATNKKKRREYILTLARKIYVSKDKFFIKIIF
jgi:hypothetical protein